MPAIQTQSKPAFDKPAPPTMPRVILVATDGTAQSDPAIAFARALAERSALEVRVVTIVDHLPTPWGGAAASIVAEYMQALQGEAFKNAELQLSRSGRSDWPVEVQVGDPASRISALARDANVDLVVVGLGGHGVTARLFGSETALRLVRVSETPVLAAAPSLTGAPRRIVVAMDFKEASIEAARLALELAASDATVILAHVVPWSRKEYLPEDWFRSHESAVGAELTRVTHWLDQDKKFRISHRLLYGKAAPCLLAYAEELNADLLVAGSHIPSLGLRAPTGQIVAKLIRGARCSVLVLPAAAAFKAHRLPLHDAPPETTEWAASLDEFSRRNIGRVARLEVDDAAIGAQVEMSGYRFLGASYEPDNRRATLMFGEVGGLGPHMVRGISNVKSVDLLRGKGGSPDVALAIADEGGQTLLVFEEPKPMSSAT